MDDDYARGYHDAINHEAASDLESPEYYQGYDEALDDMAADERRHNVNNLYDGKQKGW